MAFTKEQKTKMMSQYEEWLSKSQAVFLLEFDKMTQKDVDTVRAKAREAGGEMHVVKNTLFVNVLKNTGVEHWQRYSRKPRWSALHSMTRRPWPKWSMMPPSRTYSRSRAVCWASIR